MTSSNLTQAAEPWSLLAKAENRCKLGLTNEAVIIADEAVQAELITYLGKLEAPLPADRGEVFRILGEEGVGVSNKSLLRLSELRKRAEQIAEGEDLSAFEAEEAISIAERLVTNISERGDRLPMRGKETEFALPMKSLDQVKPVGSSREDIGQFETEFVTKLLLAKAILRSRKKRLPHFIGSMITILSVLACFFFGLIGGSGIIMTFTGRSSLSISGLLVNFLFLFIAYLFLKITTYIRGETR